MQRAEGQFRRDLTLPFALWNLCFRTTINIGHNMFAVKNAVSSALELHGDRLSQCSGKHLSVSCRQIHSI